MSKIAFFCIPAHGHTNPTLEVVKALVRLNHQVRYYSYDLMKEKILSAGAEYISCDPYDIQQKLTAQDIDRFGKDIEFSIKVLVETTLALDDALLADLRQWHPDVLIADSMAIWGKLLAKKLNVPFVSSTTTFAFNRYSARIMKQSMIKALSSLYHMNKAKKYIRLLKEKGYPINNVLEIIQNDENTDTIVYTSSYFQPCSETFNEHYAFVGPSITPQRVQASSTAESVIYISLGTVNNQLTSFYQNCIEAFRKTPYKVILSIGNQSDLKSDYENIEIHHQVSQIEVLQHASLFITHCGMNSVSEALYFEVPLVLFPQTDEQKGVANRVFELGAGMFLKSNDPKSILHAAEEVLNHPQYKKQAKKIRESFMKSGGSRQAAEKIIQTLQIAKKQKES